MPEAVIVDAVRTPIGRAVKGSLKDVRADDLAAVPLKALVDRNPEVALCDGPQALESAQFADYARDVAAHASLLGKRLA